MKSEAVRLGIIGAGAAVRKLHWPVLQKMGEHIRIAAIANLRRKTAEEFAEAIGGAKIYETYQGLLEDESIDAILISVPIELSASILIDAIEANKHVIAEKPLAATVEDGLKVVDAAARSDKVVAIAENFRYREDITKARTVIVEGLIGEVFGFQVNSRFDLDAEIRQVWTDRPWRRTGHHPGGVVLDTGIHVVSGLREVLGEVKDLYAQVLNRHPSLNGPDSLLMQLTLENGCVGHYFSCYTAKVLEESIMDLSVYGTRGSLQLSEGEVVWTTDSIKTHTSFKGAKFDRGYRLQWHNFVGSIQERESLISTTDKAFQDLLIITAGLRSAETGQRIALNELRQELGIGATGNSLARDST